ncbi:hypothetical protein L1049_024165 [Liquidambar formosana]|uniref:HSF-type DNA-binding domain-containing protein n=1 Tax=Liquidambar formosana TaxID=63359 RepID=A0AAP0RVF4_LIQFO
MDGSQGNSNAPPPFLTKTYEMVDDSSTDSIVAWSPNGRSFVVWNPPEFARDLLPKYFKHNNFSSFVRQLNTYGFRKIDPDQWEFANEEFIRGQRHLLKNIHRRKPIHSHSSQSQGNSNPLTESEKQEFEEEIERLKHDNSLLLLEVQRNNKEKKEFEFQIQSLGERVQSMEYQHRRMMAFLAQLVQKPEFASSLMQQSKIHNKKRRLLKTDDFYDEASIKENWMLTFQKENTDALSTPALSLELVEKLELSLNFWENFIHGVAQASSENIYDFGVLSVPSPVVLTEMHESSGDPETNVEPCSPTFHASPTHSRDNHSSLELVGSTSHVDSPANCSIYLNIDSRPKSSGIDVNSKPANAPGIEASKERVPGITIPAVATGVNDVFWEQFLTETPGSAETQEVQSERRDFDGRKIDKKPAADPKKSWWKMNNVDNLTEQMGHLTPAERT